MSPHATCHHSFTSQLIGPQLANRFLLTAEVSQACYCRGKRKLWCQVIKGEEAARIGLVAEAVADDSVLKRALELATIMAHNSPVAVRTCIQSLRCVHDSTPSVLTPPQAEAGRGA